MTKITILRFGNDFKNNLYMCPESREWLKRFRIWTDHEPECYEGYLTWEPKTSSWNLDSLYLSTGRTKTMIVEDKEFLQLIQHSFDESFNKNHIAKDVFKEDLKVIKNIHYLEYVKSQKDIVHMEFKSHMVYPDYKVIDFLVNRFPMPLRYYHHLNPRKCELIILRSYCYPTNVSPLLTTELQNLIINDKRVKLRLFFQGLAMGSQ